MDFNLFYGKVKSGPLAFELEKAKKKKKMHFLKQFW